MEAKKQLIGMIHLEPLPCCRGFVSTQHVLQKALDDLEALERGGADAALIENNNDRPHTVEISPEQYACFLFVAEELAKKSKIPLGIAVLLNDYKAALMIAKKIGAGFIRLDVYVDKVQSEWGVIEVDPKDIQLYRKSMGAEHIKIYTDIHVKHTTLLEPKTLEESALQAIKEKSDGIIITGSWTGIPPKREDLEKVRKLVKENGLPLIVGSGITKENVTELMKDADIAIVGTGIKENEKISEQKVKELVKIIKGGLG